MWNQGAIQVLFNTVGGERVSDYPEKNIVWFKVIRVRRGVSNFQKKTLHRGLILE